MMFPNECCPTAAACCCMDDREQTMSEYELDIARRAMERALRAGAPGLSEIMRGAIVSDAVRSIRRQLNLPAPPLPPAPHRGAT